jgi:hypothetical protein
LAQPDLSPIGIGSLTGFTQIPTSFRFSWSKPCKTATTPPPSCFVVERNFVNIPVTQVIWASSTVMTIRTAYSNFIQEYWTLRALPTIGQYVTATDGYAAHAFGPLSGIFAK